MGNYIRHKWVNAIITDRHPSTNVNRGLIKRDRTRAILLVVLYSRAKSSLHWSVIHYHVTVELQSGRGSDTTIIKS